MEESILIALITLQDVILIGDQLSYRIYQMSCFFESLHHCHSSNLIVGESWFEEK